jgi:hypothetical protein
VKCGRKCYRKKLFKMIPIDDEEGKILNGRCLHCNPLHKNNNNNNKNSSHSANNGTGRKPQRSKSYNHPDGPHRPNSLSRLPTRALSSPPQTTQPTNHSYHTSDTSTAKTDSNNSTRSERSTGNASASSQASHVPLKLKSPSPPSDPSNDWKSQLSYHGSFDSITSSSIGSLDDSAYSSTVTASTTTRRHSSHSHHRRRRPPSRQNSMGSSSNNSVGSATVASNPSSSSQLEAPKSSREELKRAALILMNAAQEHGLADAGGALAESLQDIVNVGVNVKCNDDGKMTKDNFGVVGNEDDHPQQNGGEEGGVLDRGGAFPMRSGRLIYNTGSTRTLSSMSSIDEGDRHHPFTHIFQSPQSQSQQPLRAMGKSSRTLGSLSTIDGTNEEEMNSLSGGDDSRKSSNGAGNGVFPGHAGFGPFHRLGSSTTPTLSSNEQQHREETKEYETKIEIILQRLKDSIDSSSPVRATEAIESLSEFIAMFFEDSASASWLDFYIERGLVGVLVAVMGYYSESSEIQAKACEVLTNLAGCDTSGGHQQRGSSSAKLQRSQIIVEREGGGEAILFSSMILHKDDPTVQEAALNTIRCLCKDYEENQTNFWKLDAIEPILRAMERHPNEPRVQETGAAVVSMLANNPNNENAKSTIGLNGGVAVIIRAISMHLEDLMVVESCCHALYTLLLECAHNIVFVLKAPGATNAILHAMRYHAQNLAVQAIGCAILANLTTEAEHMDALLGNGGPIGTTETTKAKQGDDGVEGKPNDELLEGLIETILETIQTHSTAPTVQEYGFAVLANLIDSDETKMFVVDMGALDAIVLAMVLHKDDVRVQERICGLLLLLAVEENHRHILAANPIELVKTAAHKFPEECLEPASRLIQQLGLEL